MAKVFERIVYDQLYHYLNENDLLSQHQSGFRSLHSTVTALIEATDNPGGGGVLPIMGYTGRLRPKGVPFSGFRYMKG